MSPLRLCRISGAILISWARNAVPEATIVTCLDLVVPVGSHLELAHLLEEHGADYTAPRQREAVVADA